MMSTDPLYLAGDLILLAGGPPILLFVVLYASRSRWESTSAGRTIMALAASLTLLYLFIVMVVTLEPGYELRGWARIVAYGLVSIALWGLLISLLRHQRRGSRRGGERPTTD